MSPISNSSGSLGSSDEPEGTFTEVSGDSVLDSSTFVQVGLAADPVEQCADIFNGVFTFFAVVGLCGGNLCR